jgi:DNA-binding GntR family transcriptional regulator
MQVQVIRSRMRRPVRRPNLSEQTYNALCDGIVNGALKPGTRIVLERLADDLGVSPTPVREAVARLMQEGLVVDDTTGKLTVVPLTRTYVHDTFWVRASLEGLAAELATPVISSSKLEALNDSLQDAAGGLARGNAAPYIESDRFFHQVIADEANSQPLVRELSALQTHTSFIRGYAQRRLGDHIHKSQEEHIRILAEMNSRNADAARQLMEAHIRRTADRIIRLTEFGDDGHDAE